MATLSDNKYSKGKPTPVADNDKDITPPRVADPASRKFKQKGDDFDDQPGLGENDDVDFGQIAFGDGDFTTSYADQKILSHEQRLRAIERGRDRVRLGKHRQNRTKTDNTAFGNIPFVTGVTASANPVKTNDRTATLVTVRFDQPKDKRNWMQAHVAVKGYKANTGYVFVADSSISPASFILESTAETITVAVGSLGFDGKSNDISKAPTTAVTLNGVVTAPPAPTIQTTLAAIPLGYQFQFNQVATQSADVVSNYNVYRNTSNTSAGATIIQVLPHNLTNGSVITVQDLPGNTTTYYYFVTSVNTMGLESGFLSAQSGTVLQGGVDLNTSNVVNGQGSAVPTTQDATPLSYNTTSIAADVNKAELHWTWTAFTIYKPNGTQLSVPVNTSLITTPTLAGGDLTQAAGGALGARTYIIRTAYLKFGMMVGISGSQSIAALANNLVTVASPATPSPNVYDGWVVLATSGAAGTERPQVTTATAFGANWTEPVGGLSIQYARYSDWNQTQAAVAYFQNGGTTGLADAQTYRFYPYYDFGSTNPRVYFYNGAHGGSGSQSDAAQMFLDGRYPLALASTGVTATCAAAGGASGSGTGGCPIEGTDILPLGSEAVSVLFGNDEWIEIKAGGYSLTATPDHRVYCERGLLPLREVAKGDKVVTKDGEAEVIERRRYKKPGRAMRVEMSLGHLYWADGILSHNVKP